MLERWSGDGCADGLEKSKHRGREIVNSVRIQVKMVRDENCGCASEAG
jgi:hypothetical protein